MNDLELESGPVTIPAPAAVPEFTRIAESTVPVADTPAVSLRVAVLSLLLAAIFGYALPVIDYKLQNTFLGGAHLPPGAIGVLLALVLVVNPLMRLISRRWQLSRTEGLTVYITCLFSSLIPGHGSENFILPNLLAPFYFATPENGWAQKLQPYLKPWLTPALHRDGSLNKFVYEAWYLGAHGQPIPWSAWLGPLLFWSTLVLVSYLMLGCLSVMLRAQWAEREALSFPLLRLPLQMTEDLDHSDTQGLLGRFFRNPIMWCGFGVAVVIQLIRRLNHYFPDVPSFPLELNTGPLFSEPPWNQIGWVPVNIYPMVVGITYLLTSEMSFSLWFFFWFMKFQYVVAYWFGFAPNLMPGAGGLPDKLFTGFQMGGCYIAYVGLVLWRAREHLSHIASRAFGRVPSGHDECREVLSYPVAFWGFVLSFAFIVGASCASGMRLDVALALWISYLVFAIGLTRVVVEGGMLALQHQTLPLGSLARLINNGPSQWLTPANGIVPASIFQSGMVYHMRGFVMPSFVHSFKLAHDHKIAPRALGTLVASVILVSFCVSWWTVIHLGYDNGALSFGHHWWAQDGPRSPHVFHGFDAQRRRHSQRLRQLAMADGRRSPDFRHNDCTQPLQFLPVPSDWLPDGFNLSSSHFLVLNMVGLVYQSALDAIRRCRCLPQAIARFSRARAGGYHNNHLLARSRWLAGPHHASAHAWLSRRLAPGDLPPSPPPW